jgi:hypothetical protein
MKTLSKTSGSRLFCLWGVLMLSIGAVFAQKFTIPVIPDTQESVTRKRGIFFSQIEWIAAKADSLKSTDSTACW